MGLFDDLRKLWNKCCSSARVHPDVPPPALPIQQQPVLPPTNNIQAVGGAQAAAHQVASPTLPMQQPVLTAAASGSQAAKSDSQPLVVKPAAAEEEAETDPLAAIFSPRARPRKTTIATTITLHELPGLPEDFDDYLSSYLYIKKKSGNQLYFIEGQTKSRKIVLTDMKLFNEELEKLIAKQMKILAVGVSVALDKSTFDALIDQLQKKQPAQDLDQKHPAVASSPISPIASVKPQTNESTTNNILMVNTQRSSIASTIEGSPSPTSATILDSGRAHAHSASLPATSPSGHSNQNTPRLFPGTGAGVASKSPRRVLLTPLVGAPTPGVHIGAHKPFALLDGSASPSPAVLGNIQRFAGSDAKRNRGSPYTPILSAHVVEPEPVHPITSGDSFTAVTAAGINLQPKL